MTLLVSARKISIICCPLTPTPSYSDQAMAGKAQPGQTPTAAALGAPSPHPTTSFCYNVFLLSSFFNGKLGSMALAHVLNFKRQVTCHHSPVWMFNVSRHACMFLKELLKDICFLILWELLTLQLQGWRFSPVSTESVWIPYKKNIK